MYEPPPRVLDANRYDPNRTSDRLHSALYHDAQTGIEPLFFKLSSAIPEYTPQGYAAPPTDDDVLHLTPEENLARLQKIKVKQTALAEGHVSGPLRDYTLALLKDISSGVHIPEMFAPSLPEGRERWKMDLASNLKKWTGNFLNKNKVDLNEFELATLAHRAYDRFARVPSKESLRITPEDIEIVEKHYSPSEIERRNRNFYYQRQE